MRIIPFQIIILLVFILGIQNHGFSQDFKIIDYESLEEKINNKNSEFYYPKLLKRYHSGDSTLSVEDYRHLYYGFTFQEEYTPFEQFALDNEISDLLSKPLNEENLNNLKQKALEYLEVQPFSLKIINYLQNFNKNLHAQEENIILQKNYDQIINAILSTGDGNSIETAYSVNYPSDEYMVLRKLGLTPTANKFETAYDYFDVAENDLGIEGVYFDIYRMAKVGTAQLNDEYVIKLEVPQLPEDAILINSDEEILQFLPVGYKILWKENIDFDQDDDQDWIFVAAKEGEETLSDFEGGQPKFRKLFVLKRNDNSILKISAENDQMIPTIDFSGTDEDSFENLAATKGQIVLNTKGGDFFKWERETIFKYREGQFYLIKDSLTSYRKGKEDQKETDVETEENFGKIPLSDFNFYSLFE